MKFTTLSILKGMAITAMLALASCEKDNGAIPDRVNIEDVPVVSTNIASNERILDTIFISTQATFSREIRVKQWFPNAVPPTKVDISIRKNEIQSTAKLFQADISTFPSTFTITAAQIETLFGQASVTGDRYDIGTDIYVGAKKYEAFPLYGLGNGSGVSGMSAIGFGEFVRLRVRP